MNFKLIDTSSKLQQAVKTWITSEADDYGNGRSDKDSIKSVLDDLAQGGCQSGMVSELIYYTDTTEFYCQHRKEIDALLVETMMESIGSHSPVDLFGDKWEKEDPLAREGSNQNLLAWFGFEETALRLALHNGIEQ